MTENEAIEELLYQEDMRGKGIDYQVNNLVIAASVKALREIQQYKAIGTAEECREAREKQIGKKPNKSDVHPYFRKHCSNIYSCPFCNKKLTHHKQKFCQYCGQAIDWSK